MKPIDARSTNAELALTFRPRFYPFPWRALIALVIAMMVSCSPQESNMEPVALHRAVLEAPPDEPSAPVGTIQGNFRVTDLGTAEYEIPINVPRGRNGIQPKLSLRYTSNQRNGQLGVGWSMKGLSIIERCGSNISYDGEVRPVRYDQFDHFCIEGQRLIAVSGTYGSNGTVYATKRDSFMKVVQHGAVPDYFEVFTKDGRVHLYGCDERTLEPNVRGSCSAVMYARNDIPRAWALRQVKDRNGNYMLVQYDRIFNDADEDWDNDGSQDYNGLPETVEFAPKRILYTGKYGSSAIAPKREISFHYTEYKWLNETERRGHRHLVRMTTSRILTHIDIRNDATANYPTLYYRMGYQTSGSSGRKLLYHIGLCDENDVCLPETHFTWSSEETTGQHLYEADSGIVPRSDEAYPMLRITPLDVNGDGYDDLVYIRDAVWRLLLSTGDIHTPFLEEIELMPACVIYNVYGDVQWYDKAFPLDLNNDGKHDLVIQTCESDTLDIFISNGMGFDEVEEPAWGLADNTAISTKRGVWVLFGDIVGSGDRLVKRSPNGDQTRYVDHLLEHVVPVNGPEIYRYFVRAAGSVVHVEQRTQNGALGYDTDKRYYFRDNLGSTNVIADEIGNIEETVWFDPFGHPRMDSWDGPTGSYAQLGGQHGFTGHQHDDDIPGGSLINAGARSYDPFLGRFVSSDPLYKIYDLQGLNKYSYVENKPTSMVDPSGMLSIFSTQYIEVDLGIFTFINGFNSFVGAAAVFYGVIGNLGSPSRVDVHGQGGSGIVYNTWLAQVGDYGAVYGHLATPPDMILSRKEADEGLYRMALDFGDELSNGKREEKERVGPGQVGLLESLIPVWGSARNSFDNFENDEYGWSIFNGVMAVTDVFIIKALVYNGIKAAGKGLIKLGAYFAKRAAKRRAIIGAADEIITSGFGKGAGKTLYRAVGPNELKDLVNVGCYRSAAGHTEGKDLDYSSKEKISLLDP